MRADGRYKNRALHVYDKRKVDDRGFQVKWRIFSSQRAVWLKFSAAAQLLLMSFLKRNVVDYNGCDYQYAADDLGDFQLFMQEYAAQNCS